MSALIKFFRRDDPTEEVNLGDLDIVKISLIAWAERKNLELSKKFICSTCCLSTVVVLVQMAILLYLEFDVVDIMFCGDVVRNINSDQTDIEQFFAGKGKDTHRTY